MNLGVMTVLYGDKSLEETLKLLSGLGVQSVELGAGGYPGNTHLDAVATLNDDSKAKELLALVEQYNMHICAISVHNNPVHPDKKFAANAHENFFNACKVAQKLGIETIITDRKSVV